MKKLATLLLAAGLVGCSTFPRINLDEIKVVAQDGPKIYLGIDKNEDGEFELVGEYQIIGIGPRFYYLKYIRKHEQ